MPCIAHPNARSYLGPFRTLGAEVGDSGWALGFIGFGLERVT